MSKRVTNTNKIELVETQNILLSLQRLSTHCGGYGRYKRALYHALLMDNTLSHDTMTKIRIALELP